jgi:hypothetical protein
MHGCDSSDPAMLRLFHMLPEKKAGGPEEVHYVELVILGMRYHEKAFSADMTTNGQACLRW